MQTYLVGKGTRVHQLGGFFVLRLPVSVHINTMNAREHYGIADNQPFGFIALLTKRCHNFYYLYLLYLKADIKAYWKS